MAVIKTVHSANSPGKRKLSPHHSYQENLDPHAAAAYLKLSASTLARYRMLKTGPPYFVVGNNSIRYALEDLREYASARKVTHESQ